MSNSISFGITDTLNPTLTRYHPRSDGSVGGVPLMTSLESRRLEKKKEGKLAY